MQIQYFSEMHMTGLQGKALWGNNLQWVKLGLESVN